MAPKNDTEESNGNEYYYSNEKAFEDYLKGEREKYISAPKYFVYKDVGLRNDGDGGVKYEAESPATIIKTNSDVVIAETRYIKTNKIKQDHFQEKLLTTFKN